MDDLLYHYAGAILLAAVLVTICIWSPRRVRVKLVALIIAALFMPAAYAGLAGLMSRPKPVSLEWVQREASEATVLGADFREGEAIYVWLQVPGVSEPRAYVLPWNKNTAKQLMKATRQAEKRGQKVKMGQPFERSLDEREGKFYTEPQRQLPAKPAPVQTPLEY